MTDIPSPTPTLSPEFERARKLSRILAVVLTVAFWLGVIVGPLLSLWLLNGAEERVHWLAHFRLLHHGFSNPVAVCLLMAMLIPSLGALYFARRVFSDFANG